MNFISSWTFRRSSTTSVAVQPSITRLNAFFFKQKINQKKKGNKCTIFDRRGKRARCGLCSLAGGVVGVLCADAADADQYANRTQGVVSLALSLFFFCINIVIYLLLSLLFPFMSGFLFIFSPFLGDRPGFFFFKDPIKFHKDFQQLVHII